MHERKNVDKLEAGAKIILRRGDGQRKHISLGPHSPWLVIANAFEKRRRREKEREREKEVGSEARSVWTRLRDETRRGEAR